jgi:hypothetical protein
MEGTAYYVADKTREHPCASPASVKGSHVFYFDENFFEPINIQQWQQNLTKVMT